MRKDMTGARVQDAWLPLAFSGDVAGQDPVARRAFGQDYVLFRDGQGIARALEDRCAHRRVPLSLGKVLPSGIIECGYHGWRFDGGSGRCVSIAMLGEDGRVPPVYRVAKFDTAEKDGFVLVWRGAPGSAGGLPNLALEIDGAPASGEHAITLPHDAFVRTLLDAPSLLIDLGPLFIEPAQLGDPIVSEGGAVTMQFGVHRHAIERRSIAPPDPPFILEVAAQPITGVCRLRLSDIAHNVLLSAIIVSEPVIDAVTQLRWRAACQPEMARNEHLAFAVKAAVDAGELRAVRPSGAGRLWATPVSAEDHAEAKRVEG